MAWEWRGQRLYLYQKEWTNGSCRSVYAGPASREITRLGAQLDRIERERRCVARREAAEEQERWAAVAATPPILLELERAARQAVADALHAAGYHQHDRGAWRKQRGKGKKDRSP